MPLGAYLAAYGAAKKLKQKRAERSAALANDEQAMNDAFANSGLSEDFRDQFNSNWNAYNPLSIKDTFWDSVSNFFGARSSADKLRMQQEQARNEQIAQLVGVKREQDYNSEAEQASRLRNAGINPDLQGLGDAAEATEVTEPEARPDFSALTSGRDIANGFANALTTALSIYSGVQGIISQGIDISTQQIQRAVGSEDSFFSILKSIFSPESLRSYLDPSSDKFGTGWSPDMSNVFEKRTLRDLGITSYSARKMLASRVNTFLGSMSAQVKKYKTFDEFLDSQNSYAKKVSEWFRPSGFNSTDEEITSALQSWNKVLHDLEVKSNSFQRTYYTLLKADKQAEAMNAAAEFQKFSNQKKMELYRMLTKSNSKFSLILATTLMGDNNVMNSVSSLASSAGKFL